MLLIPGALKIRREIREKAFAEAYVKAFAEAYPKAFAEGCAEYDQRVKEALDRFGYEVNGCPTLPFTPEVERFLAGADGRYGESALLRAARKWRILGRK